MQIGCSRCFPIALWPQPAGNGSAEPFWHRPENCFAKHGMAERVGHSKTGITNHYSHSYETKGKEVAEMLNKIMEEMSDVSKELGQ